MLNRKLKHELHAHTNGVLFRDPERIADFLEELSLQAADVAERLQDIGLSQHMRRDLYRLLERIEFDRGRILKTLSSEMIARMANFGPA